MKTKSVRAAIVTLVVSAFLVVAGPVPSASAQVGADLSLGELLEGIADGGFGLLGTPRGSLDIGREGQLFANGELVNIEVTYSCDAITLNLAGLDGERSIAINVSQASEVYNTQPGSLVATGAGEVATPFCDGEEHTITRAVLASHNGFQTGRAGVEATMIICDIRGCQRLVSSLIVFFDF